MKNIEELKKKHEQEMKLALLENDLETMLGSSFSVMVYNHKFGGADIQVKVRSSKGECLSLDMMKHVLTLLPQTCKTTQKKYVNGNYVDFDIDYCLTLKNDYRGNSRLDVQYVSGDMLINFVTDTKIVEDCVYPASRNLTSSELSAYTNVYNYKQIGERTTALYWGSKDSTVYQGGNCVLWDESEINRIINEIKNSGNDGN